MDRKGDYGYDAPYALVTFPALGSVAVVAAIVSWWRQSGHAAILGFYAAFFLTNAASFFYTDQEHDPRDRPVLGHLQS